jgi:hypothetical protein
MSDNGTQVTSSELNRRAFFEEDATPEEVARDLKALRDANK